MRFALWQEKLAVLDDWSLILWIFFGIFRRPWRRLYDVKKKFAVDQNCSLCENCFGFVVRAGLPLLALLCRVMKRGILLIDHGSRRSEAHQQLVDLGERLEARANDPQIFVEVAHMEIAEPSIFAGFLACVQRGASEVVAIPCLLSRGRHVSEDIPRLLAEAAEGSGIPFSLAAPLVEHEGFIELLLTAARSNS